MSDSKKSQTDWHMDTIHKHRGKVMTNHSKRSLVNTEKEVITFLDSSSNRNRSSSYVARIKWWSNVSYVELVHGRVVLEVNPMILVSLVGKRLVKIRHDKIKLDITGVTRRSPSALREDGFFEDTLIVEL